MTGAESVTLLCNCWLLLIFLLSMLTLTRLFIDNNSGFLKYKTIIPKYIEIKKKSILVLALPKFALFSLSFFALFVTVFRNHGKCSFTKEHIFECNNSAKHQYTKSLNTS